MKFDAPMFQQVKDGSCTWTRRRETHQIHRNTPVKSFIFKAFMCHCCVLRSEKNTLCEENCSFVKYKILWEIIFLVYKNLDFVQLRIYLSKSISNFDVLSMCNLWHLLHRTGFNTPGYRVNKHNTLHVFQVIK
jgi:hypothetical protein